MADDRVLPETRWASWAIVAILLPAVFALWILPGRTADLWAWTIAPDMTAVFMGAGYGAGAYFFARTALGRRWHEASAGVLSAAIFAALMLIPTFVHWDRFNHGDAPFAAAFAFYGWVVVYLAAPLLVGWIWWRNRRTDPRRPAPGEPRVSPRFALGARAVGAGALLAAAVFLLSPTVAIDVWPWQLTPLTARVLACFVAQVGTGAILLSLDRRWGSWRLLVQTFLVATALMLIGAVRRWDDFEHGHVSTYLFVGGLLALAALLNALHVQMERAAAR